VCIGSQCFTLEKDNKGHYIWPGSAPAAPVVPSVVKTPPPATVVPVHVLKPVDDLPRRKLEHSTNFTFLYMKPMASTHEKGEFIVKKLTRQRWLDLVMHEFDEQQRRNPGSEFILVCKHKLIKHSGHINSPKIQALIGYAVTKGYIKFKSAFEKDKTKAFHLSFEDRPMIDTNFKVFSVDKYCTEDYQAKI